MTEQVAAMDVAGVSPVSSEEGGVEELDFAGDVVLCGAGLVRGRALAF
ncbi:hypothetical protein [Nonomuraea maheshkhaliensis]